ncbi:MAG: hypothetical protein WDA13_00565 [Candidatus Shapirobacteria bacterium]
MKIISIDNHTISTDCIGCSLARKEFDPYGGIIFESKYFIVAPDIEIPIPGFIIISSKRHISSILDFSQDELSDFNQLLTDTRKAIKQALPNITITMVQKENRPHFHIWFFPKFDWMEKFGEKLSGISELLVYSRKNLKKETNLKELLNVNLKIKNYFEKL